MGRSRGTLSRRQFLCRWAALSRPYTPHGTPGMEKCDLSGFCHRDRCSQWYVPWWKTGLIFLRHPARQSCIMRSSGEIAQVETVILADGTKKSACHLLPHESSLDDPGAKAAGKHGCICKLRLSGKSGGICSVQQYV